MITINVILLVLNVISGCFNIVRMVLADVEQDQNKKTTAAIVGSLNWAAVFVLALTLIRDVQ